MLHGMTWRSAAQLVGTLTAVALVGAACGGGENGDAEDGTPTATSAPVATSAPTGAPAPVTTSTPAPHPPGPELGVVYTDDALNLILRTYGLPPKELCDALDEGRIPPMSEISSYWNPALYDVDSSGAALRQARDTAIAACEASGGGA